MADEIDNAQAYDQFFLGLALKKQSQGQRSTPTADQPTHCIDCDEEIPEARRRAVPGCKRCVDCQSLHENWRPV